MVESLVNMTASSPTLWFAAAVLVLFLIAIAVGSLAVFRSELAEGDFRRKMALMPAFAELQAAAASLGEKRRERDELLKELDTLRKQQAEAQRHQLDAQHWQAIAEQAKRDYDNRQNLIDEVERLRTAYEDAAKDLAARVEEVADLTRTRSDLGMEIEAARTKLKELEDQRQRAEDLTKQLAELNSRRDELFKELDGIKDQRDERLRAAFEVDQLFRRRVELEQALQALPDTLKELERRRDVLTLELEDLRRDADRLRNMRDEIDRLEDRQTVLSAEIEVLKREKERLESPVTAISGHGEVDAVDSQQIADLLLKPSCLFGDGDALLLPHAVKETDEVAMLMGVKEYLKKLNLDFEERVLYRFHTSLKTAFISPLTVLAGISGTGKSQLPQRYAEAMGLHFLKVAVQPRWDSPQDLLGFYNYLEKSYKATELARTLVHMDSTFKFLKEEGNAANRMLLVLLDEMNLARVEYYFSEFLSRLEGRPESDTTASDLPGRIDFGVPGRKDPLSVYPGHNVLFVGTMNEDESTQALSDKVLDRANTLRFRKPEILSSTTLKEPNRAMRAHLPFQTWKGWQRRAEDLAGAHQALVDAFVNRLNGFLANIGRPFGHRVNQAIHAYVANYPEVTTGSTVQRALADTLALRILPKLRGMELEDKTGNVLRQIALLAQELGDDDLHKGIEQGLKSGDVFLWTG